MHVANVTEELANIIDQGYFVIELWGHHGAGFLDQTDNESEPGYVCMYVCTYVCMYVYVRTYICDWICN